MQKIYSEEHANSIYFYRIEDGQKRYLTQSELAKLKALHLCDICNAEHMEILKKQDYLR